MMETSWTCVANGFRTVCSSRLSDRDWTLAVSASVVAVLGACLMLWRMIQKDRARLERLGVAMDILLTLEEMSERRSDPSVEDLDAVAEEERVREATARPIRRVVFDGAGNASVAYFEDEELRRIAECPRVMGASEVLDHRMQIRAGVAR